MKIKPEGLTDALSLLTIDMCQLPTNARPWRRLFCTFLFLFSFFFHALSSYLVNRGRLNPCTKNSPLGDFDDHMLSSNWISKQCWQGHSQASVNQPTSVSRGQNTYLYLSSKIHKRIILKQDFCHTSCSMDRISSFFFWSCKRQEEKQCVVWYGNKLTLYITMLYASNAHQLSLVTVLTFAD